MRRLDRYLAGVMLLGGVPVLLLLLGLFGFVVLAEELEDVGKGRFDDADALRAALLTLPRIAIDLLPVAALLGGVTALGNLAAQQELTALRAAGLSQWRMAYPLLLAGVLLSALALLSQQYLVPRFEQSATELRAKALVNTVHGGETAEFWTRNARHFIRVGDVRFGSVPADIEIYDVAVDRTVERMVLADRADVLGPGRWVLHDVSETQIGSDRVGISRQPEREWQSFLTPDQMASLIAPMETLTVTDLAAYVDYLDDAGLNSHRYRFRLWEVASLPIALLAMCLLGLPFVLGSTRARPPGARILFGATVGIGFYLAEQTASQLTMLYELPAAAMAVLPDSILLAAGVVLLSRVE